MYDEATVRALMVGYSSDVEVLLSNGWRAEDIIEELTRDFVNVLQPLGLAKYRLGNMQGPPPIMEIDTPDDVPEEDLAFIRARHYKERLQEAGVEKAAVYEMLSSQYGVEVAAVLCPGYQPPEICSQEDNMERLNKIRAERKARRAR